MTNAEKQWWEQERAKGYNRFLLRQGLLRTGLPFGILMTIAAPLIEFLTHRPIKPVWELLAMFGFYTLGFGYFMGTRAWRDNERDYQEPTEDEDVAQ